MMQRDAKVDVLKTVGILSVVLAHVNPPEWLFNIRVFDVCMLVFASGLTLKYHGSSLKAYVNYLTKRFKRLIIPTWMFLLVYFGFAFIMSFSNEQWKYAIEDYIKSFTFTGGIDYIWIIRVYFLMAIVSPLVVKVSESNIYKKYWLVYIAGLFAVNELLSYVSGYITSEMLQKMFQGFLVYTLGYSIIELVACSTKKISFSKMIIAIVTAFFLLWFLCGFVSPQTAKYPPQALYILYGLFVSMVFYRILEKRTMRDDGSVMRMIKWVSSNSLWIYFWHIIPVTFISKMGWREMHFVVKYIMVLVIACMLTVIQNSLGNTVFRRNQENEKM